MPRIDDLEFSRMVVNGKVYRAPCLVFRDRVNGRWWRTNGMVYGSGDFEEVLNASPEVVILGTGMNGAITVEPSILEMFDAAGIACEIYDTREAVERFNSLFDTGKNIAGAFHLI